MARKSHQEKAVNFLFIIFTILIIGISAITSFSFFFIYFGNLIPEGVMDTLIRQIISGFIGMLLLDIAAVIWLLAFLHHSETSEQRAISLSMTIITFIGAAMASVAYLSLTATGELELGQATKEIIGISALVVVIGGIILNFAAAQAYNRYSLESKQAVREADRKEVIQEAQDEQAEYLDKLVAKGIREKLMELAPGLAAQQANSLAGKFYNQEESKYAKPVNKQTIGAFTSPVKVEDVKEEKKQGQ